MDREKIREEIELLIDLEHHYGLSDYGKGILDTYVKIFNEEFMWDTQESIYDRIKNEKNYPIKPKGEKPNIADVV